MDIFLIFLSIILFIIILHLLYKQSQIKVNENDIIKQYHEKYQKEYEVKMQQLQSKQDKLYNELYDKLDTDRRIQEQERRLQEHKWYEEFDEKRRKEEERRAKEEKEWYSEWDSKRKNLQAALDEEIEVRKERNKKLKIELASWIEEEKANAEIQVEKIHDWISDWKSKQDAVVESYKKLDELNNKDSYHRIVLSEEEVVELEELNKAIKKLKNPLPFRKAIYDVYYKPKVNELVLRIIGKQKVSGIYKIIHVQSGRTYVGQSVDIGNRWKQHAKRGCGADQITQNKLYPAMLQFGLESFHFEVVEEIEDTNKLNEAEKYWQEYFKAQEFGYSMK